MQFYSAAVEGAAPRAPGGAAAAPFLPSSTGPRASEARPPGIPAGPLPCPASRPSRAAACKRDDLAYASPQGQAGLWQDRPRRSGGRRGPRAPGRPPPPAPPFPAPPSAGSASRRLTRTGAG